MKSLHILPLLLFLTLLSCTRQPVDVLWLHDPQTGAPLVIYAESKGFALILDTGTQQSQFSVDLATRLRWKIVDRTAPGYDLTGQRDFDQEGVNASLVLGQSTVLLDKVPLLPPVDSPTVAALRAHLPLPLGGILGMDVLRDYRFEFGSNSILLTRADRPSSATPVPGSENVFSWSLNGVDVPGVIDTGYNGGMVEVRFSRPITTISPGDTMVSELVHRAFSPGGADVLSELTFIRSVQFGSKKWPGVTLASLLGPQVPNYDLVPSYLLVGLDFLQSQGAVVDFAAGSLSFEAKTSPMIRNEWDLLAIDTQETPRGTVVTKILPSHPWYPAGLRAGDQLVAQGNRWGPAPHRDAAATLDFLRALADASVLVIDRGGQVVRFEK